jgi:hypothetical protein
MLLAEPGSGRIPPGWRVVNAGTSGATLASITARRDAANSWATALLAGGQNVAAVEIGRNDFSSTAAATQYAGFVPYLNTAATGLLQRGWTVRVLANIASASTLMAQITPYRALIRAAQFLTDTQSGPGQAFEGRVSVIGTDLITSGAAGTVFSTAADAADTLFYQGDTTHPTPAGALLRVTGGDTPANGIGAGL